MRPTVHTVVFWFKLLGALALVGLPLLLLVGCQTRPTVTAPAPIPLEGRAPAPQSITAAPTHLATR